MPTRQKPPTRRPAPTERPFVKPTARPLGAGKTRGIAKAATAQTGAHAPTRIKVMAIREGYYDHIRRREGDVFFIKDRQAFSQIWMREVNAATPERVTSSPQALRRQHDELLAERVPPQGTVLAHDEPDADSNPLDA